MEEFEDRLLTCDECGAQFLFTARDQSYYKEKGFLHPPKRCRACRQARKGSHGGPGGGGGGGGPAFPRSPARDRQAAGSPGGEGAAGGDRPGRETFTITCSSCGVETSVPFKPDPNRPVYCRNCYSAKRRGQQQ